MKLSTTKIFPNLQGDWMTSNTVILNQLSTVYLKQKN